MKTTTALLRIIKHTDWERERLLLGWDTNNSPTLSYTHTQTFRRKHTAGGEREPQDLRRAIVRAISQKLNYQKIDFSPKRKRANEQASEGGGGGVTTRKNRIRNRNDCVVIKPWRHAGKKNQTFFFLG